MWQIDNRTPFAAAGTWVRDRDGREVWITAVKATFELGADGALRIAQQQDPVRAAPLHRGAPQCSSLLAESDLVLTKRTTDIAVEGIAHAPLGREVEAMEVQVRVGPVLKRLRVTGDRRWRRGAPGPAQAFTQMPIVYERAFGGMDPQAGATAQDMRNPVGTGFCVGGEGPEASAPPNVEYPDERVLWWRDRPRPAGLGVVAAHWQPRARWAGTYDAGWMATRQPLVPDDFDERYFQSVPEDQQAPHFLQGGEPVLLHGLSPAGDLAFHLPRCTPRFQTHFLRGPPLRHTGQLHSVLLAPPRCGLVFHSALPCHERGDWLERTVVSCDWTALAPHLPAGAAPASACT
ncbi:DUF2169 domain-containing protein [Pseudorhodoferax sp. Leaf265]|uniref:DUF2169 family type VI secretion system accessory protein n=1 Tax=Pseudorhodoferax sp. Leaf265 TaxID=1736315 RepID=UPI0007C85F3E|nr:DUF2169 domain-containing protein [Pseudorhodoferax sp. Leaf265]